MNELWRNSVENRFGVKIEYQATYDRIVFTVDNEVQFTLDYQESVDLVAGVAYQINLLEKK